MRVASHLQKKPPDQIRGLFLLVMPSIIVMTTIILVNNNNRPSMPVIMMLRTIYHNDFPAGRRRGSSNSYANPNLCVCCLERAG